MQDARETSRDLDTADWHPRVIEMYRYWRSIRPANARSLSE
jgi:hypothetical protein